MQPLNLNATKEKKEPMDTDELTPMAYDCIRLADEATDVLKSELGAACSEYRTEDEYLSGILEDVQEIEKDPRAYLDGWNLLDQTDLRAFKRKITILREYIEKTIATALAERGKPEW
jgi:hypothetical protein